MTPTDAPPKGYFRTIVIYVLAILEPFPGIFEEITVYACAEIAVSFPDIVYGQVRGPPVIVQIAPHIYQQSPQRMAIGESDGSKKIGSMLSPLPIRKMSVDVFDGNELF